MQLLSLLQIIYLKPTNLQNKLIHTSFQSDSSFIAIAQILTTENAEFTEQSELKDYLKEK